ncbi:MAG: F420-nonreducing hydrogenase [Thermoprotei archaeon]|nr:MAG: F420-nonreducing hydrogenase [Thermoprotei archaeon]
MIKVALVGLSGYCSGCEVALIDLGQEILTKVNIVYSTLVADYEEIPSNIDLSLVSGAVRTEHDIEILKEIREKSSKVIALGTCASFGGIPGLANLYVVRDMLKEVYGEKVLPVEVLKLTRAAAPVSEYIEVDYMIPGCPPPYKLLRDTLLSIVEKNTFPKPPFKTVCDECPLEKKDEFSSKVYRLGEIEIDPSRCLLEQGILCMGIATVAGCKAHCPSRGAPCRGCRGPPPSISDQGERLLSAIASVFSRIDPQQLLEKIPDPAGYFYRFTLPSGTIPYNVEVLRRVKHEDRD